MTDRRFLYIDVFRLPVRRDRCEAALEAGCTRLCTEDLHNGYEIGGLTIIDPFAG